MRKSLCALFLIVMGVGLLVLSHEIHILRSNFVVVNDCVQYQVEALSDAVFDLLETHINEPTSQHAVELLEKCTFTVLSPYGPGLFGSATLIDKERGILLTAAHVAEEIPFEVRYSGVVIPILTCGWSEELDLGLFVVDPNLIRDLDCVVVPFAETDPGSGTEVFASGYPEIAGGNQVVFSGMALSAVEEVQYGRIRLVDLPSLSGMSGGPVVNLSGELVGIGTMSYIARTCFGASLSVGLSGMTAIGDIKESLDGLLVGDPNGFCQR